jgi:hypothetical protein
VGEARVARGEEEKKKEREKALLRSQRSFGG